MYRLVHEMRARIIKSPAFTGDKVMGAILFERTMDREIDGTPTAEYLWDQARRRALPEGRQGPRRRSRTASS
jgi:fructose-bisphosphate aldolase class I